MQVNTKTGRYQLVMIFLPAFIDFNSEVYYNLLLLILTKCENINDYLFIIL